MTNMESAWPSNFQVGDQIAALEKEGEEKLHC